MIPKTSEEWDKILVRRSTIEAFLRELPESFDESVQRNYGVKDWQEYAANILRARMEDSFRAGYWEARGEILRALGLDEILRQERLGK